MKIKKQIEQLKKLVAEWDTLPLAEAEFNLFGRLAEALAAYEYEVRSGQAAPGRVCIKCGVMEKQCNC